MATGCMDSDYDLNNVDLTMGIGSDGLGLKMGTTEKIFLNDILSVDESVKLDGQNLYYLVEDGHTDFSVHVNKVQAQFNESLVRTRYRVLTFADVLAQNPLLAGGSSLNVPAGSIFSGTAEGNSKTDFKVEGISSEISEISDVYTTDTKLELRIRLVRADGVEVSIDHISNFQITLPKVATVSNISPGWALSGNVLTHSGDLVVGDDPICTVSVDQLTLGSCSKPVDGSIILSEEMSNTAMKGTVFFKADKNFTMSDGDYADIELSLDLANSNVVNVEKVRGRFCPAINPDVETIEVGSSLPDFLQDDAVRISVANPTLKFMANMEKTPVSLNIGASLTSEKSGVDGFSRTVVLPSAPLVTGVENTIYYHQASSPYDPEGVSAGATTRQVENLSSLVEQLPEHITVDMTGGRLSVADEFFAIELGRDYSATANYNVYVPFEFSNGLTIVYNDSTESMLEDLEDYTAEGVKACATVENTIPLALQATITPYDTNGNILSGVSFSDALIAASTDGVSVATSEIELKAQLADPMLLRSIDHLKFTIKAASQESTANRKLLSTQYLQFKNVRLYLTGKVTADLN